jgi:hypothetical protein
VLKLKTFQAQVSGSGSGDPTPLITDYINYFLICFLLLYSLPIFKAWPLVTHQAAQVFYGTELIQEMPLIIKSIKKHPEGELTSECVIIKLYFRYYWKVFTDIYKTQLYLMLLVSSNEAFAHHLGTEPFQSLIFIKTSVSINLSFYLPSLGFSNSLCENATSQFASSPPLNFIHAGTAYPSGSL